MNICLKRLKIYKNIKYNYGQQNINKADISSVTKVLKIS